ncbi:hypothetical protein B296_00026995 [Ensete ventricosum]|uniref:Uncharacterized protein n=1 Tax=Ensete ventricosum TaxID=4639 RepID=A0A426YMH5_ENSVE|nr:hypothetical protein B296_00026995 [Ensete ventricosum]
MHQARYKLIFGPKSNWAWSLMLTVSIRARAEGLTMDLNTTAESPRGIPPAIYARAGGRGGRDDDGASSCADRDFRLCACVGPRKVAVRDDGSARYGSTDRSTSPSGHSKQQAVDPALPPVT